jgi:hypothetical protein
MCGCIWLHLSVAALSRVGQLLWYICDANNENAIQNHLRVGRPVLHVAVLKLTVNTQAAST